MNLSGCPRVGAIRICSAIFALWRRQDFENKSHLTCHNLHITIGRYLPPCFRRGLSSSSHHDSPAAPSCSWNLEMITWRAALNYKLSAVAVAAPPQEMLRFFKLGSFKRPTTAAERAERPNEAPSVTDDGRRTICADRERSRGTK